MRSGFFWGLAASIAIAPLAANATGPGSSGSQMHVGHAPGASPPAPRPGGWGAGGWNGGMPGGHWQGMRPLPPRPGGWGGGHWAGRGSWGVPPGPHRRLNRGQRIAPFFVTPSFFIPNWNYYGLADPGYGRNWVRYYDDAMLIDGEGTIYDARYGIDWDRYDSGPVPEYVGGYDDEDDGPPPPPPPMMPPPAPGTRVVHVPPGSTVVIQSDPVTTTTTTTTTTYVEEVERPRARRSTHARRAPRRAHCACR